MSYRCLLVLFFLASEIACSGTFAQDAKSKSDFSYELETEKSVRDLRERRTREHNLRSIHYAKAAMEAYAKTYVATRSTEDAELAGELVIEYGKAMQHSYEIGQRFDREKTFAEVFAKKIPATISSVGKSVPHPATVVSAHLVQIVDSSLNDYVSQPTPSNPYGYSEITGDPEALDAYQERNDGRIRETLKVGKLLKHQDVSEGYLTNWLNARFVQTSVGKPLREFDNLDLDAALEARKVRTSTRNFYSRMMKINLPPTQTTLDGREVATDQDLRTSFPKATEELDREKQSAYRNQMEKKIESLEKQISGLKRESSELGDVLNDATRLMAEMQGEAQAAYADLTEQNEAFFNEFAQQNALIFSAIKDLDAKLFPEITAEQKAQLAKWKRDKKKAEDRTYFLDSTSRLFATASSFFGRKGKKDAALVFEKLSTLSDLTKRFVELEHLTNQINQNGDINELFNAGLTANWVELGLQVMNLFSGPGESMDVQILKAIQQLSRQMHQRFDRIEDAIVYLNADMNSQFERVFGFLEQIGEISFENKQRLRLIQGEIAQLSRSVDRVGVEIKDLLTMELLADLKGVIDSYLVRSYEQQNLTQESLNNGLSQLATWITTKSKLPHFDARFATITDSRTEFDALRNAKSLPFDNFRSLESVFWLDKFLFDAELPPSFGDFPHALVVMDAYAAFDALVRENWRSYGYEYDPIPRLDQFDRLANQVRQAFEFGRTHARFKALSEAQLNKFRECLAKVDSIWTDFKSTRHCELPTEKQKLIAIFVNGPNSANESRPELDQEWPAKQLREISHFGSLIPFTLDGTPNNQIPPNLELTIPSVVRAWSSVRKQNSLPLVIEKVDVNFDRWKVSKEFSKNNREVWMQRPVIKFAITLNAALSGDSDDDKNSTRVLEYEVVGNDGHKRRHIKPLKESTFEGNEENISDYNDYVLSLRPSERMSSDDKETLRAIWNESKSSMFARDRVEWVGNSRLVVELLSDDLVEIRRRFLEEIISEVCLNNEQVGSAQIDWMPYEEALALNRLIIKLDGLDRLSKLHLAMFASDFVVNTRRQKNSKTGVSLDSEIVVQVVEELVLGTNSLIEKIKSDPKLKGLEQIIQKKKNATEQQVTQNIAEVRFRSQMQSLIRHLEETERAQMSIPAIDVTRARIRATRSDYLFRNRVNKQVIAFQSLLN